MTALDRWKEAAADVARGRPPAVLAAVVGVTQQSVQNWLSGRCIPTAGRWRALVIEAKLEDHWAELSAARDAVARPAGRPRLADEEYAAGIVARRNRKAATRAAPGAP